MGDLHTTHWSLHTEYSIVNTTYISLHTVTFILHAEYYTLQLTHWILCTAHYTLHTAQYTIHTQYITLHTVQDTLHATNWIQHTIYLLVSFINVINVCMAILTHASPKAYQDIICANLCKPVQTYSEDNWTNVEKFSHISHLCMAWTQRDDVNCLSCGLNLGGIPKLRIFVIIVIITLQKWNF